MCELYAVNSRDTVNIKPNCDLFYQHSIDHPDGWGLSFWQRNAAIVYRSPLRALDDTKYCAYLQKDLWCTSAMVHIRLATVGVMSSINCHPFRHADYSGRIWTFMHNGTAFQDSMLEPYKHLCRGDTDSEAVFYFILDAINRAIKAKADTLISRVCLLFFTYFLQQRFNIRRSHFFKEFFLVICSFIDANTVSIYQ